MNNATVTPETVQPEVIFDIDFADGLLFISLRNIGSRPAYGVRTHLSPLLHGFGGTQVLNELPVFSGIEFFAPGKEIRFLIDSAAAWFARREPVEIAAQLEYSDDRGNSYRTTVKHNLEIYRSLTYLAR
jgi:hypothetical protein